MVKAVAKGKAGEVEFCKWLDENFGIKVERNYNQAFGGADITVQDFIFEIKRRETLDLAGWWRQVSAAKALHEKKEGRQLVPVVAFRQNRKKWEFLIPSEMVGVQFGYIRLEETVFKRWMQNFIEGVGCGVGN